MTFDIETFSSITDYCPLTGALTYNSAPSKFHPSMVGRTAMVQERKTSVTEGYKWMCKLGSKRMAATRVIWYKMTGELPTELLGFADNDSLNMKWDNIIEKSPMKRGRGSMLHDRKTGKVRTSSGRIGVCWDRQRSKWLATMKYNNKNIYLGRHELFEDAVEAREAAERKYHKD